jgi:addiction module HigA family antidote
MRKKLKPVAPGEMLAEERLAKEIGAPAQRIGEIIAGKRAIVADTDLQLCRSVGLSDGCWPRLQADDDTEIARRALEGTLARLKPWPSQREHAASAC